MKYAIFFTLILIAVLILPELLMAQMPGLPGPPNQTPIDGGLGLLAAGGAAYALHRLRRRRD
jgi:hypothetical protein